jgi:hypothetical protein
MAFKLTYSDGQEDDYDDSTQWEVEGGVLKMGQEPGKWTVLVSPSHWATIEMGRPKTKIETKTTTATTSTTKTVDLTADGQPITATRPQLVTLRCVVRRGARQVLAVSRPWLARWLRLAGRTPDNRVSQVIADRGFASCNARKVLACRQFRSFGARRGAMSRAATAVLDPVNAGSA